MVGGRGGMADALVLGASTIGVRVQVPSPAPGKKSWFLPALLLFCCLNCVSLYNKYDRLLSNSLKQIAQILFFWLTVNKKQNKQKNVLTIMKKWFKIIWHRDEAMHWSGLEIKLLIYLRLFCRTVYLEATVLKKISKKLLTNEIKCGKIIWRRESRGLVRSELTIGPWKLNNMTNN